MLNIIPFGQACKLQNGKAFKPSDWVNEGTPIVRIQNLNDETKPFNYCNTDVEERFHIDSGDLLFSWSGTPGTSFGAFFWNRGKAFLNQHIFKVTVDSNEVDKNYLRYAINSKLRQIIDQAHGGVGLKHITKGKLEAIEIPLPPLPEQKRIAAILDKADAIRRKRQQAIELADEFLRSVFLELFGDPVTNPKGWTFYPLNDLTLSFQNGAYFPKDKYNESGTEMVHMSDAFYETVKAGKLKRVLASSKDIEKYKLTDNDLLISRRSLNYEGSAKPCLIVNSSEDLIFESSLIRIQPDLEKLLITYLYYYLKEPRARSKYLFKYVTKSTISGINQANLKKVEIMLPPLELQKKFRRIVESINKLKMDHQHSMVFLNDQFNSLSQQAFAGKL